MFSPPNRALSVLAVSVDDHLLTVPDLSPCVKQTPVIIFCVAFEKIK